LFGANFRTRGRVLGLDGLYVRLAAEEAAQVVSMRVVPRQAAARKDSVRVTQAGTDAAQINRAPFH
jgi:hypothetical protein